MSTKKTHETSNAIAATAEAIGKVSKVKTTPVKAAAKKAPVKKPAAKKAPAKKAPAKAAPKPAYRTDYKPDTRVKVTRRDGTVVSGRVVSVEKKTTGSFITVNVGTKQVPILLALRPAKVKGF